MMDQRGMVPWRPASSHSHELTPKQRREETLLQPFYEEQARQEHARRHHEIKSMEATCQMRDHRRLLIYQTFQERLKERRSKELYEVLTHASLLTSWDNIEKQDFATKVDVFEKIERELNLEMIMDCYNYENDVKLFESRGYELGADAAIDSSLESNNKDKGKEKRKDTSKVSKETKASKKSKLDDLLDTTQDGSNVLYDIKERVLRIEKEKFETDQKRRLDALEAKQRERELEESTRKKEEDEKLLRDQQVQSLKAEELRAVENQEKEKIALRLELEQQIAEQRSREWEAVLARDHELLLMMKHDRDNEVNFEQRLWQEERLKRLELKQLKHRNLCYEVLLQIVSLAESSAIYKASTNCVLSSIDWWEWKNLFVKGAIQPVSLDTKSSAMDALFMEGDEVAEEAAVMDYINEQGEWESLQPIGTNKELGNIIASLFHTEEIDPSLGPPSFLSHMQLKLAVIGSPFAGKTFVAKLLEDRFGIVRIEIEKIIASAIADAEREEEFSKTQQRDDQALSIGESNIKTSDETTSLEPIPSHKTASEGTQSPTISTRIALGRQARTAVANGLQVPDEVTVQLLLLALESLDDSVSETQSLSPKDMKKKDLPSKEPSPRLKGNSDMRPPSETSLTPPASHRKVAKEKALPLKEGQHMKKRTAGFILDGFPNTQQQAAVLQKGLSGLKLSLESKTTAFTSVLAPPPDSDLIATKLAYPLDALFILDTLEEGDALKQAMGKYIDPKTGLSYHLEFEPPPPNDRTGIASRLKPIEDVTAAGKRINEGILIWNVLYEWITTFSNVHLIYHDERKRFNLEEAHMTIQGLLDAKLKVSAAADAAFAAAEAEDAASSAAREAEKASFQARAIAQKLFLAKLAEVEALTLLERSSNDLVAKDILKKKVSESTSRILQEATKSVKDAEAYAIAAKKAAEDAFQAKQTADEALLSVSAVMQAKEEALAAAELAKVSASKAAAASQRAQLSADNASLNLADATSCVDNLDKNSLKQKISDLSTQPTQEEVEKPLVVESVTQSTQAEQSCAENLCKLWQEIEGTYLSKLKEFFVKLRIERKESQISLKGVKGTFAMLLKKQDERQGCLDDFQGKYNRVDASQRSTIKMKKQLQKKAEEFFQKIYFICEGFFKEAEVTREKSLSTWTQQRMEAISQCFIMLIQIEMERFLQTCCLLHEYYFKNSSSPIKDKFSGGANFPSPRSKQGKNLPALPGWLPSIADAFPQLHQ